MHIGKMANKVEMWPPEALKPYDRNPRTHTKAQIAQIAASIARFGFTAPILVDGESGILAGHGRLAAALDLGLETVPVIVLDHLDENERRAYIIADNKIAENAGWDMQLLAEELEAIRASGVLDEGPIEIGFSDEELAALLDDVPPEKEVENEDAVPEVRERAVSKEGEVWILGRHRVVCGDVTSSEHLALLMADQPADMLWTDPPYNVDYQSADGDKIENDNMSSADFGAFMRQALDRVVEHMKPGACFYIAHSDLERHTVQQAVIDSGLVPKQCLIWVKSAPTLSRQDYNWKHEALLYGWKLGAPHYFNEDFRQTTVLDDTKDFKKMDHDALVELLETIRTEWNNSVVYAPKPSRNELHPTMKPVQLVRRQIRASSRPVQIILDPFAGSGSTLIAAEILGRRAFCLELVPHYVDVIIRRWQDYAKRDALLEATGQSFEDVAKERKQ